MDLVTHNDSKMDKKKKHKIGKWQKDHLSDQIIRDPSTNVQTRRRTIITYSLLSNIKLKNIIEEI